MKQLFSYLSVCFLGLSFFCTSCQEDDPIEPNAPIAKDGVYVGDYKAYLADGTLSKQGSAQTMRLVEGTESDTLYMDQISFTDKVPYAFDIRFCGIQKQENGKVLTLSPEEVVPEMVMKGQWAPVERYMISEFSGSLSGDSLYLSFKCGENLLQFAGKQ